MVILYTKRGSEPLFQVKSVEELRDTLNDLYRESIVNFLADSVIEIITPNKPIFYLYY